MKKKMLISFLIVFLLAGTLLGASYLSGSLSKDESYRIVFIPKIIDENNDFWTSVIAGAQMAAEEYDVELAIRAGYSETDYDGQNMRIEAAIKEKPDAILVAPCSFEDNTETLQKVKDSGIPLTLIDSVVDREVQDMVVASDNQLAASRLGEYAASLINDGDQIGVVAHVQGSSTALERVEGFRAGLGEKNNNIMEVVYSNSDTAQAYEQTESLIERYPDIRLIAGLNEPSAVGAAEAIRDSGKLDQIIMVGFDSSIEEIKLMEDGVIRGIVIQKPFNMGYLGVKQTVDRLSGERQEKVMDSGSKLITMENLYDEENQKLLFPFISDR